MGDTADKPSPQIKILAISDTHLGEDCSLLSFPHGRWHLWDMLGNKLPQELEKAGIPRRDKLVVEELVMVGDIPDRCLSSTSQIITQTNDFTSMMGSVADIKKSVYVVGNHDHTLWSKYIQGKQASASGVTPPCGDQIINCASCAQAPQRFTTEMLTMFFGYDKGSSWRHLKDIWAGYAPGRFWHNEFEFWVANPVYAVEEFGRTYVFAHGTHFDDIVKWVDQIRDLSEDAWNKVKDFFSRLWHASRAAGGPANLAGIETDLSDVIDAIWPSSGNNSTPWRDDFWYAVCRVGEKFDLKRPGPKETRLFSWNDLKNNLAAGRINNLTRKGKPIANSSIERFRDQFWPLLQPGIQGKNKITFVTGHTHIGGWGELHDKSRKPPVNIRVYDLGGWVAYSKEHHPACHVFVLDALGNEYIFDISFTSPLLIVEGQQLLDVVQQDAENRHRLISQLIRRQAR